MQTLHTISENICADYMGALCLLGALFAVFSFDQADGLCTGGNGITMN